MASSDRQDRRIARQRGAWRGARELKDADFEFRLGGTPSGPVTRRTPSATPSATSLQRKRIQSASRSKTQTPAERATSSRARNSSANGQTEVKQPDLITPAQQTRKRKRQLGKEIKSAKRVSPRTSGRARSEDQTSGTGVEQDELEQISPEHETSLLSSREQKQTSIPSTETHSRQTDSVTAKPSARRRSSRKTRTPLADIDEDSVAILNQAEAGAADEDELGSVEPILSSGRKSDSAQVTRSLAIGHSTNFAPEPEGTVEEATDVQDDDLDAIGEPAFSPQDSSRLAVRRPSTLPSRKLPKQVKKRPSKPPRRERAVLGPSIPIRVYRLSKTSEENTDPLGAIVLPGLNPADALSQCLMEMCKMYIDKEKSRETRSARKLQALGAFRTAVQDSLFDISAAQNTVYTLTGRLKRVKREQSDLRAELMGLKKERDEIGLKSDGVRAKYQEWAKAEEEKQQLVKDLQEFRTAVEKHRESIEDQAGMESEQPQVERVQDVLREVQAIMQNGGLLQTTRNWNTFVEQKLERLQSQ